MHLNSAVPTFVLVKSLEGESCEPSSEPARPKKQQKEHNKVTNYDSNWALVFF
jgi:hypothetical protein